MIFLIELNNETIYDIENLTDTAVETDEDLEGVIELLVEKLKRKGE